MDNANPLNHIHNPDLRHFANASAVGLGAYALAASGTPIKNNADRAARMAGSTVNGYLLLHFVIFPLLIVWACVTLWIGTALSPAGTLGPNFPFSWQITAPSIIGMAILQLLPLWFFVAMFRHGRRKKRIRKQELALAEQRDPPVTWTITARASDDAEIAARLRAIGLFPSS